VEILNSVKFIICNHTKFHVHHFIGSSVVHTSKLIFHTFVLL
jgi:hypothetical protein